MRISAIWAMLNCGLLFAGATRSWYVTSEPETPGSGGELWHKTQRVCSIDWTRVGIEPPVQALAAGAAPASDTELGLELPLPVGLELSAAGSLPEPRWPDTGPMQANEGSVKRRRPRRSA